MTTLDLLEAVKTAHGGVSDYRAAQLLGVKPQTVYSWKSGKSGMADEVALRAAELLELDPVDVLLDLHIERERGNATSQVWKEMKERLLVALGPVSVGLAGYIGGAVVGGPLI